MGHHKMSKERKKSTKANLVLNARARSIVWWPWLDCHPGACLCHEKEFMEAGTKVS